MMEMAPPVLRSGPIEVEVSNHTDEAEWNGRVLRHPFGRFDDTTLRHEAACRCYPDTLRYYLTAHLDGREVGWLGFCETYLGHDLLNWMPAWRPLIGLCRLGLRTFDHFTIPIVLEPELEAQVTVALLDAVDELARRRHIYQLAHLRYPAPGAVPALPESWFAARGFQRKAHGTFLVDLSVDLDQLWSNLKQEARTAVRKAGKQGIEVRLGQGEEELTRYYELFRQNRVRDQRKGMLRPIYSEDSITDHVRFFAEQGLLKLFCAWKDGTMGSCTMAKYYNGIVSFNSHARGDEWHRSNLHDGDLLCWEMIRWAKEQGYRYFDLTGFDVVPANDRQRGIQRFKAKWGGEPVYYGFLSKVYGGAREKAVAIARRLRA
ncbi:MAG: GNAT family N-acetyltransferase [Candidatus Latescibacteria bacterium]|nr:GNAT family N-acetyltransferase [Candidatus Latescibacterota bacterium]